MDAEIEKKDLNFFVENITCYLSVEEEVLKLLCLFQHCYANLRNKEEDFLTRSYVLEKVSKVLNGSPIILDSNAVAKYLLIKIKQGYSDEKNSD